LWIGAAQIYVRQVTSHEGVTAMCVPLRPQVVGDPEHVKVFATTDAAEKWFEENDPEGVAFEYEVIGAE
jgi:hypothetical protein